jgi:MOSC domain-containing protein YiiM
VAKVIQLNTSLGGIPKFPIDRALVGSLGIYGDKHRFRYHGGPSKALLVAAAELIDELRSEGWPLFYGALGENLTTRGLVARDWRLGQRYRAGSVILEFTQPRQPCKALDRYGLGLQKRVYDQAVKANNHDSAKWGYSGLYAAVVQPGIIKPEDIIEAVKHDV